MRRIRTTALVTVVWAVEVLTVLLLNTAKTLGFAINLVQRCKEADTTSLSRPCAVRKGMCKMVFS